MEWSVVDIKKKTAMKYVGCRRGFAVSSFLLAEMDFCKSAEGGYRWGVAGGIPDWQGEMMALAANRSNDTKPNISIKRKQS